MIRALVVDDEPKARRWLRRLLADVEWVECVGEAADGAEAVALARTLRPDLVFLDVRMPGLDGVAAFKRLDPRPAAIFTTAYDDYAVTAFDLEAVDYLVKPFGRARLSQALERARRTLDAGRGAGGAPLQRLFVRDRGRLVAVPLGGVERISAEGDYLRIHTATRQHLVHGRLKTLERLLPADFLRIHRSHIVNLTHVRSVERAGPERLSVRLSDGSSVSASRRLSARLRRRLG